MSWREDDRYSGATTNPRPSPMEAIAQEEEEDQRMVLAAFRNSEDGRLFRAYFMDGTYLAIDGSEAQWSKGWPPEEGEEVEPGETGWEAASWNDLPWEVRERVRLTLEDSIAPYGEGLAEELLRHSYEEQLRLIEVRPDLHEWSLAQVLFKKSREEVLTDPRSAVGLGKVATHLTSFFHGYTPELVVELRARILAHLGNALRVLGELTAAEEAFREAREWLAACGSHAPRATEAEILALQAALFRDERRFDDALQALQAARGLYEAEGALPLAAQVLREQRNILEERGHLGR
jgi:tetratricopeptide (TPR) repeat protein